MEGRVLDNKAFSEKLASERQRFLKFIVKQVGDAALAEDLLQESFLKCLNVRSLPDDEDKVQAWFYQVIKSVVSDYFRQLKAKHKHTKTVVLEENMISTQELTDSLQCACELFFWSEISESHQKILKEVDLAGKSLKLFAEENDLSYGAARVVRHRARKAMGQAILKMCKCFDEQADDCPCPSLSNQASE